jgi:flagellar protein FlaG
MNTIAPASNLLGPAAIVRSSGASARPDGSESSLPPVQAVPAQALQAASAARPAPPGRGSEDRAALQQKLDDTLKDVQTSLQFRVDDEANRVVVSVVDRGSGDVIYQIPSEVALRIAKRMAELGSGMINESA